MSKTITLQMLSDPGHGWIRFPKKRLEKLGIANKISSYSYQRGDTAFLEEDCDFTILIDALKANGYSTVLVENSFTNRSSKIRSYSSY
jgi:hypothetical protein